MTFRLDARNLIVPDWAAPPNVRALITTRGGGVSQGSYAGLNLGRNIGDDINAVTRNRELLRKHLPNEPIWLTQQHGTTVASADDGVATNADASVTRKPGIVCAVLTADCLPVLLCDRGGSVVAIAHAGWRGLAAGVIENTVAAMDASAATLNAYLGPAIGPAAFEVGEDVLRAFVDADPEAETAFVPKSPGKWLADLYTLACRQLNRCGVRDIYGGGLCTFSDAAHFFSHRRDKITGRFASLIWLD